MTQKQNHLSLDYWMNYLEGLIEFKESGKKDRWKLSTEPQDLLYNVESVINPLEENKIDAEIDRCRAIISVLNYKFEIFHPQ